MTVPDEAVGAAWRAALANDSIRSLWRNADPEWRESYKSTLRAALTAAAPFIAAQAWDAAVQYADDQGCLLYHEAKGIKSHNPYRSEQ